jgi:cytochrome b involved in lipid metabolism
MKKIIISVLGLLIVGAGAFYVYEMKEESEMNTFVNETEMQKVNPTEVVNTETNVSTSNTSVVAPVKSFSLAQVAEHNRKEDCWMVINDSVIDVTSFISKHPGGDKIIKGCGIDATGYFNKVGAHMKGIAQTIVNKLTIGKLAK